MRYNQLKLLSNTTKEKTELTHKAWPIGKPYKGVLVILKDTRPFDKRKWVKVYDQGYRCLADCLHHEVTPDVLDTLIRIYHIEVNKLKLIWSTPVSCDERMYAILVRRIKANMEKDRARKARIARSGGIAC
jgi:hypothetical protein